MKVPPDLVNTASSDASTVVGGRRRVDALLEALPDREAFVMCMIESSHDCFKLIDLDGRLISVNSGGLQALGIEDFAPFRGSMWCELWPREFRGAVRRAVETARAGGLGRFIGCYPTVDGTPKWWDVAVRAMLDRESRPRLLLAISRDITDSRKTENLLRASIWRPRSKSATYS